MSQRQSELLRLRDLLDHLATCQDQLEWTEDAPMAHYLTDAMLRDIEDCRRICQRLHRAARLQTVN